MSTVAIVVIVIVVLGVLGVAGFVVRGREHRRGLRERFGPEYDRAIERHDSTREAEQELLARQKRHDTLEIRPLAPEARERSIAEWLQVQERFVDAPEPAVTDADRLLVRVMGERGYPAEGFEQRVSDLSVEHAGTIDRYRAAHDIGTRAEAGQASTEDLRQAMLHYRALFAELLGTEEDAVANGHGRGAERETERAGATPDEPVAPVAGEAAPAGAAEREAVGAKTAARAEISAGARTTAGRLTARRDGEDEGSVRR